MRISDWSSDVCSSDLSRQGQLIGRGVAGQCRAGTQGGAFAHGDRRHQLRVRTHEYIVFDDGAEFIDAVVIAGNRARADIDALADGRVANVREMVGLGCGRSEERREGKECVSTCELRGATYD